MTEVERLDISHIHEQVTHIIWHALRSNDRRALLELEELTTLELFELQRALARTSRLILAVCAARERESRNAITSRA